MNSIASKTTILAGASLMLFLAGCSEPYMHRQDRIAASAGDAIEANKVTHVVEPWPRDSFNTGPRTSGQRAGPAMDRYYVGGRGGAAASGAAAPSTSASTSSTVR